MRTTALKVVSPMIAPQQPRKLTDADVEAIAAAFHKKFKEEFYRDLGKGVWSFAWKMIVASLIGIAAYGAAKHEIGR